MPGQAGISSRNLDQRVKVYLLWSATSRASANPWRGSLIPLSLNGGRGSSGLRRTWLPGPQIEPLPVRQCVEDEIVDAQCFT